MLEKNHLQFCQPSSRFSVFIKIYQELSKVQLIKLLNILLKNIHTVSKNVIVTEIKIRIEMDIKIH